MWCDCLLRANLLAIPRRDDHRANSNTRTKRRGEMLTNDTLKVPTQSNRLIRLILVFSELHILLVDGRVQRGGGQVSKDTQTCAQKATEVVKGCRWIRLPSERGLLVVDNVR